jgi:hypothetical protein
MCKRDEIIRNRTNRNLSIRSGSGSYAYIRNAKKEKKLFLASFGLFSLSFPGS